MDSHQEGNTVQLPKFVEATQKWQDGKDANEVIEGLKKESEICDHHIERMATKHTLALQRSIRPRLRSIPGFWPFALSNLETFSSLACMSADLDALSSLEDVELVVDWRDPRAYSLVFHFGENKYFSNKTLTRSYVLREGQKGAGEVAKYAEEGGEKDDGEVTEEQLQFDHSEDLKALPCKIDWKEPNSDKTNLCKLLPRSTDDEDSDDEEEDVGVPSGSFFHWFADENDVVMTDLGWEIREEGISRCVDCYLGLNSNEFEDESDDDEEEDEDDEEDGDDAEEIDLEEEESKPPAKRAKRA